MTDLNLTHLKQIAINAVEPASVEIAGLKEGTLTYGFDTDPFKASKFYETFDPPTVLALIDRIEQAEHRAKRYKALAETRLETIQRVRDLAARLEGGEHPLGKFIATDIHQALEGDPK